MANPTKHAPTMQQRDALITFTVLGIRVHMHAPEQRARRCDFDEAVDSKPYQGDAAGEDACHHRQQSFKTVPGDEKYSNRLPRCAIAARSSAILSNCSSYLSFVLGAVIESTRIVLALSLPVTVAFWPANLSIAA